ELASEKKTKQEKGLAYLWIHDENHIQTKAFESKNKLTAKLKMEGEETKPIRCQNVIGMVEGTDPKLKNEFIIYSAHYDHTGIGPADETGDNIYNGARDNAVGITTVLSMAGSMAKCANNRSALFVVFAAYDKWLLCSE